jgi:hypothetical protein
MALPYHRGNTMQRGWGNNSSNGNKDRAAEVSTTLMELENNQRWVSNNLLCVSSSHESH